MLLVDLVLHYGDALAGRRAPEIEVRSADDELGERDDGRTGGSGIGAGKSTCTAPEFPTESSPIPSS